MEQSQMLLLDYALDVQKLIGTNQFTCNFTNEECYITLTTSQRVDLLELVSVINPTKCRIWGEENELHIRIYAPRNENE